MYETPTPDKLKSFMVDNDLTGADIAALTGVNPRTARRWIAPPDQKGARPIPWSSWALILLLTGKMSVDNLFAMISKWKAETAGRGLFERSKAGRPIKDGKK